MLPPKLNKILKILLIQLFHKMQWQSDIYVKDKRNFFIKFFFKTEQLKGQENMLCLCIKYIYI